jgi:hypothetical protein
MQTRNLKSNRRDVLLRATSTTFTGPSMIDDYSPAVSSPTYFGALDGPYLGLLAKDTIVVPVAPGTVAV